MNQSALKNMVILKNLPANIVEEAIIILRANKKIKQNEKIDKNFKEKEEQVKNKENNYILKEAEMLVSNYISKIEQRKKEKLEIQKKIDIKCKKFKKTIIIMSIIIFLETIFLIIK